MNEKGFASIIITLIIAILVGGGVLYFSKTHIVSPLNKVIEPSPPSPVHENPPPPIVQPPPPAKVIPPPSPVTSKPITPAPPTKTNRPPVSVVPPPVTTIPPPPIAPPPLPITPPPIDFSIVTFNRSVETMIPSCSDQKNFEIISNDSAATHFKPACFPGYFVQNEGFFLESNHRPMSMLPKTCGGFNILVLFFNTQNNEALLKANSYVSQDIKNKIDINPSEALTDLFNTYTYNDLFGFLPVKPEVSLKFTIKLSNKNSSLDLSDDTTDMASDYNKYDAIMLLDEIGTSSTGSKIAGGNVSKWPERDPLFQALSSRSFYAFKINPQNLSPGLVYNELFRRNVPVLFSEYTKGARVLVHRDGYIYDETPIYNPRNNKYLSRSDQVLLSSILNGWYDVDHDGVQDCRQSVIRSTADNVDGDMIPDDFDPDLTKDNSTFFWKSF